MIAIHLMPILCILFVSAFFSTWTYMNIRESLQCTFGSPIYLQCLPHFRFKVQRSVIKIQKLHVMFYLFPHNFAHKSTHTKVLKTHGLWHRFNTLTNKSINAHQRPKRLWFKSYISERNGPFSQNKEQHLSKSIRSSP